jgi:histidyl-tRNA synthetase
MPSIQNNAITAGAQERPLTPRGFPDREGADIAAADAMMAKIREVYSLYGFEAVETPFVEYTEALGKFLPDLDRPNEGVFSFKDDDERWLSLRYDLTAPLARYVAENYERLPKPYRSYRAGWVFRNEKPGPGRFRQFMQFDADTVGSASPAADAEMCMMAADCLEALGVKRGDYVIKVNNRKVLDGVMEAIGLGGAENAGRRLTVLRALDKLDRLGPGGMRALLGAGRKDESGDFTKGAGLADENIDLILGALGLEDGRKEFLTLEYLDLIGDIGRDGAKELKEIKQQVIAAGYVEDRIRIDPTVVRGLEYYTGPVFEAELTFETPGEDGRPIRFGSVGGGGRYDGLVARFRSEPVPATGFSIGVSRLLAALRAIDSPIVAESAKPGPVVVLVLDRDRLADYQRLVAELRGAGIAAELYLGGAGMNAQLKYADRRRSLCAVIQGSNERDAPGGPQVVVRDLALGAELAKASKDRSDYLEMRRRAQIAAPRAELVPRVREVLARGGAPLLGPGAWAGRRVAEEFKTPYRRRQSSEQTKREGSDTA